MTASRRKQGSHGDERNFFRIDDEVYLEFRVLTEVPPDKTKLASGAKETRAHDVMSDLIVVNSQIQPLLDSIKTHDVAIARCLEALSKKIDIVARAVSKSGETFKAVKPNKKVNLSAGGVSFNVATQLLPQTPVEVRMSIVSSNLVITAYGEVTYCEREGRDREHPYRIGVKFPALSVADRQALFAHVLGRHTEKIRGAKMTGEGAHTPDPILKKSG